MDGTWFCQDKHPIFVEMSQNVQRCQVLGLENRYLSLVPTTSRPIAGGSFQVLISSFLSLVLDGIKKNAKAVLES